MNLTAVKEENEMMESHVEDSLVIIDPIRSSYLAHCSKSLEIMSVVDVGSGWIFASYYKFWMFYSYSPTRYTHIAYLNRTVLRTRWLLQRSLMLQGCTESFLPLIRVGGMFLLRVTIPRRKLQEPFDACFSFANVFCGITQQIRAKISSYMRKRWFQNPKEISSRSSSSAFPKFFLLSDSLYHLHAQYTAYTSFIIFGYRGNGLDELFRLNLDVMV
ncbi:unnamed protein product [Fraxinus pennsylvanica]|uniref:Uncharacterized protein n=1 Tax=Fraxinus pennsylvanica TaxID=56036 RepID=A0AAD2DJR6_9LAMI|nr:unnamed protein product [Fraxinus pennsylvanica]